MNTDYAEAIPPAQLAHRLHCSCHNAEATEEERENFCVFCEEKYRRGMAFRSLREAWEAYCYQNPVVSQTTEVSPEQSAAWETELKADFDRRSQFGNYNETGGQQ